MGDESMTYTQQGMVYGMLFGTVVAILLYSLTNDVVYFAFMGLPMAIGLSIGSYLDSREKKAE